MMWQTWPISWFFLKFVHWESYCLGAAQKIIALVAMINHQKMMIWGYPLCTILMYNAFPRESRGHGSCGNCPAGEGAMGTNDVVNCERKGRGQWNDAELHGQEEHNNNITLNKDRGRLSGYNMIVSERWIALMSLSSFYHFPFQTMRGCGTVVLQQLCMRQDWGTIPCFPSNIPLVTCLTHVGCWILHS